MPFFDSLNMASLFLILVMTACVWEEVFMTVREDNPKLCDTEDKNPTFSVQRNERLAFDLCVKKQSKQSTLKATLKYEKTRGAGSSAYTRAIINSKPGATTNTFKFHIVIPNVTEKLITYNRWFVYVENVIDTRSRSRSKRVGQKYFQFSMKLKVPDPTSTEQPKPTPTSNGGPTSLNSHTSLSSSSSGTDDIFTIAIAGSSVLAVIVIIVLVVLFISYKKMAREGEESSAAPPSYEGTYASIDTVRKPEKGKSSPKAQNGSNPGPSKATPDSTGRYLSDEGLVYVTVEVTRPTSDPKVKKQDQKEATSRYDPVEYVTMSSFATSK